MKSIDKWRLLPTFVFVFLFSCAALYATINSPSDNDNICDNASFSVSGTATVGPITIEIGRKDNNNLVASQSTTATTQGYAVQFTPGMGGWPHTECIIKELPSGGTPDSIDVEFVGCIPE